MSAPFTGERRAGGARSSPGWMDRIFWIVDRARFRLFTGPRHVLGPPRPDRWGTMRLTTAGRHTGRERAALLGYIEDGHNLVAISINAWADAEPAWWLNLQAHPDAVAELWDGVRPVRARAAEGEERARLWARWRELGERSGMTLMADIDASAARLSRRPAIVVLEPAAGQHGDGSAPTPAGEVTR